jgi:hypothetical protein
VWNSRVPSPSPALAGRGAPHVSRRARPASAGKTATAKAGTVPLSDPRHGRTREAAFLFGSRPSFPLPLFPPFVFFV